MTIENASSHKFDGPVLTASVTCIVIAHFSVEWLRNKFAQVACDSKLADIEYIVICGDGVLFA